ncbi:MAG: S8 family serine peptidase [Egibacteraceae bacterium]
MTAPARTYLTLAAVVAALAAAPAASAQTPAPTHAAPPVPAGLADTIDRVAGPTKDGEVAPVRPLQVIVEFADDAGEKGRLAAAAAVDGELLRVSGPHTRLIGLPPGASGQEALGTLRERADVVSAVPNHVARAAGYTPDDPGDGAGWEAVQWNFLAAHGVNAPDAWTNLREAGRPGGKGVIVAVIDSGVAYRNDGRHRLSPDFTRSQFVRGYDFLRDSPYPVDSSGHGTHIAGTIAERTNNGFGVTGLAYGSRIMPLRVLDSEGFGDAEDMTRAIRFAAREGADVINLSIEFNDEVEARDIPNLLEAIKYARKKGVNVVAASGNSAADRVPYPARAPGVIAVGATTESGCLAEYSNAGRMVDLVAPGGGRDANVPGDPSCSPDNEGRNIVQMTFDGRVDDFLLAQDYEGTSMSAPHVAGTVALVLASGVLGDDPKPKEVEWHIEDAARDLGSRRLYGHGLVDAAAATRPR